MSDFLSCAPHKNLALDFFKNERHFFVGGRDLTTGEQSLRSEMRCKSTKKIPNFAYFSDFIWLNEK